LSELPAIYLARHGETAWSVTGQHTRLTDLSLTERGECNARTLGKRLEGLEFARVFVSPLQRASRTCELAGFARRPKSIGSWSNGTTEKYEGLRTVDIHAKRPDWEMFRDGFPGGESLDCVGARADRVVSRIRPVNGLVLLFSSGHFLRGLAARWLDLQAATAQYFLLSTASLSTLTYEHTRSQSAIGLWNDTHHVTP
jgi:broad specificity phosphatase PhoE